MDHKLFAEHQKIFQDVLDERERQDEKFGALRHHHPFLWNTILTEEVGEVAEASLEMYFGLRTKDYYRKELIQVAAVAIAAIQDLDKNGIYDDTNSK